MLYVTDVKKYDVRLDKRNYHIKFQDSCGVPLVSLTPQKFAWLSHIVIDGGNIRVTKVAFGYCFTNSLDPMFI